VVPLDALLGQPGREGELADGARGFLGHQVSMPDRGHMPP
jgi:hypothetical protein